MVNIRQTSERGGGVAVVVERRGEGDEEKKNNDARWRRGDVVMENAKR